MIDTHTHLYSKEFDEDIDAVIERAKDVGVTKFILPSIDSSSHDLMKNLKNKYPNQMALMMGLHPCYVSEDTVVDELDIIKKELFENINTGYVAVGEIGIDLHWQKDNLQIQTEAFETQIEWAKTLELPICIHSRNSFEEVLSVIEKKENNSLKGVIHCFSGDYTTAKRFLDLGFYLGIGGVLTYKNSGLTEAIEKVPLERIILETDAPYLSPVPHRGKRNESSFLVYVRDLLAKGKNIEANSVDKITSQNAMELFKLN